MRFTEPLSDTQLAVIKALKQRGSPAPACDGFLFLNLHMIAKFEDVRELVKRGLLYCVDDSDKYYLTRDGHRLAEKIR